MKRIGGRQVWSITDVTEAVARRFEDVPSIWVEAELQDLRGSAGQMWFTLRGEHQIDASMNRIVFERLAHRPADGMLVQAYGRITFWRARAQVSMRVERLEPSGEGLLRAQIAELRGRLEAEGLLAAARKRPLPRLPRRVGVVTSPEGAARDDVLRNLWARFPAADVLLVTAPVQGDGAPAAIVRAIRHLDASPRVDVIVVTRGGGSLEDLMAYNSEPVCRAVAAARTPVVSAVGHERDLTLCDLVADRRVSTPTAAAQAVVPEARDLDAALDAHARALRRGLTHASERAATRVRAGEAGLVRGLRNAGANARARLDGDARRLGPLLTRVAGRAPAELAAAEARLTRAAGARLAASGERTERAATLLGLLSPQRTVARGYAIVRRAADDTVVSRAASAAPGEALSLQLPDGRLAVRAGAASEQAA